MLERQNESELIRTWRMSNEANLFLLDHLSEEHLSARYASRTRTVADQFAHMHAVRLRWLRHLNTPDLPETLSGSEASVPALREALEASEDAVADFLADCEERGAVKGWNGPPASFLGYLVAHEAHHRGLAMVALRVSGHRLSNEVVYGLWEWGKKRSKR